MIISNVRSNTLLEVHSGIVQHAELVWGEPEVHRLHRSVGSADEILYHVNVNPHTYVRMYRYNYHNSPVAVHYDKSFDYCDLITKSKTLV